MSEIETRVAAHYGASGLLERVRDGLRAAGHDPDNASAEALRPFESFHVGGAQAVEDLLDQLPLGAEIRALDIGCGVGGAVRALARRGATATGIDLTPEFVATADAMSRMIGATGTGFLLGSALDMPFGDAEFDVATLLHVGMNIADKPGLMRETARVLRPGGTFAVYDIMRRDPGDLAYPMPWATTADTSFPVTPDDYLAAATAAGFTLVAERRRAEFGIAVLAAMAAPTDAPPRVSATSVPAAGPTVDRLLNLLAAMRAGQLEPVELILRLPA